MKKIFNGLQTLLIIGILTSILCFSFYFKSWLGNMSIILTFILAGLNFVYVLYKGKKNIISASLIIFGLILSLIADVFIVKNPIVFFIMLSLSEISLMSALIFNNKFCKLDICYILAISIPFLLMVNLSPVFGYSSVGNRILISFVIISFSALLGLSVSHLIRKQSAFNILFTITSFFNLIFGLGLIIQKQSTLTHRVAPIFDIVFYSLIFLFSVTIFLINKDFTTPTITLKRNIIYSVNIMLVVLLIGYTFVSNCLAYNLFSAKIYKDQFLSMVDNSLDIPIIEIYTQDNEQPKSKENYVNCSFKISNCEDEEYNFSVPMAKKYKDDGCVGIRLRGNSTRKARKQPYRIKFDKKQSFFNLDPNKSWVLLAEYFDQSYIRNYAAFTIADSFDNLDFTPTPHHVALIINNEFKGLYVLCEQIDEKEGRTSVDQDFDVSVDKEFPFLAELDFYAKDEGVTCVDNFYVEAVDNYVEIKFPESDERQKTETSDIVYDYIYEYINAVFTLIKTNQPINVSFRDEAVSLKDLVNIDSIVDYYLLNEIMLNTDNSRKSIYLHKQKNGLMQFGPIWDFDYSLATEWEVPYNKSYIEDANKLVLAKTSEIYNNLLKNKDFYDAVAARYQEKSSAILEVCNMLKDYKNVIEEVAVIDANMWHGTTGEFQFDMQYDYVRLFLLDRYAYLNTIFAKSHAEFLLLLD